tara:strand:- start:261 stop:527 length:267 start_codon:yes stop_codon:yes gene_type:complete
MKDNLYVFINAWKAPSDDEAEAFGSALMSITLAAIIGSLVEPHFKIGLSNSDPTSMLDIDKDAPFIMVEDINGDNFFVKKAELNAAFG